MALMSVEEALRRVAGPTEALAEEWVPVSAAAGRVLARDLIANRSQPPADMSAMDGYAVRAADIVDTPARLAVIGESAAGRPFTGAVGRGECVRIFTGAVLPAGADTVVIQENTTREGAVMTTTAPTAARRNVRKAGCDFAKGAPGLAAGHRITARGMMLAAAMDHARVPVARRPRVALLQTGDELVMPGEGSGADAEIVVSNAFGLAAIARGAGAEVIDLGVVGDDLSVIRAAIRRAVDEGADVLVSSGGASVGDHDLMAPALKAEQVDLEVHKIALRPGKPLMFGRRGALRVLGLPGNPVSSQVCGLLFLTPLLRALQGETGPAYRTLPARLGCAMPANDWRMDFMRARLAADGAGGLLATPLPVQDSSLLSVLASADALLIRPADAPAAEAGAPCEVIPFQD
ncbi:gephyrin-like molybdotransferase Glp [Xanthobacter sp. KR7-225]|uniref:molybdopterin molybdotransferase MoeA n=1 Tax=Xanthobacter sp. KR7-225 TaxID=3156613 RepID=UPI0032B33BAA